MLKSSLIDDRLAAFPLPWTIREIRRHEINVWCLAATDANAATFAKYMSDADRAHAEGFYNRTSRNEAIVARGFLRLVLGHHLGIAPRSVMIVYGEYGKPELAGSLSRVPLRFNWAHSKGLVVAAVSLDEIGIDLEFVDPTINFTEIVSETFSSAEAAFLLQAPPGERRREFFRSWTRKEAFLKAIGVGVSDGMKAIEILHSDRPPRDFVARFRGAELNDPWRLLELDVHSDFAAAVAIAVPKCVLNVWHCQKGTLSIPRINNFSHGAVVV